MNFHGTLREDRDSWRTMPITRAALALLREHAESAARDVTSAAAGGSEQEVRVAAGKQRGLELALALLSEE